jgi:hypothetical protein
VGRAATLSGIGPAESSEERASGGRLDRSAVAADARRPALEVGRWRVRSFGRIIALRTASKPGGIVRRSTLRFALTYPEPSVAQPA